MADVSSLKKKVRNPIRWMGAKSTDVEGPVLYYEFGTFTIDDNVTSSTLPTGLTNVVGWILTPMNLSAASVALPFSPLTLSSGKITITTVDPGASGAIYSYVLFGTVETV